jgi:diguanylate cyclase (GGDEF)-like protein
MRWGRAEAQREAGGMKIPAIFEQRGKGFWTVLGLVLIALLGAIDLYTGPEIAFAFFYLIPVSLVAWFLGRGLGVFTSIVSAGVWLLVDLLTREPYSHGLIPYWNATTRVGFFVIVAWLLSALKASFSREKVMARTDYVTGAINARFFSELAQMEIDRAKRYGHPFTFAYVDLDHFKTVNDRFGHRAGDRVLGTVTKTISANLRKTDIIARLGGDEFALLLPETGAEAGSFAVSKIRRTLLGEMEKVHWPVTFSIGVITYIGPPSSVDEMIREGDDLMYSVKRSGKNGIACRVNPREEKQGETKAQPG